MHEMSLTVDMLDAITSRMTDYPGRRVSRVVLEIGREAAVLADALRFCFEICAEQPPVAGAILEIIETPGAEMRIKYLEVE